MKSLRRAVQRHPELSTATRSARGLLRHFGTVPPNSLRPLLIRTGPFDAPTDAFRFPNSFPITEENGQQMDVMKCVFVEKYSPLRPPDSLKLN